MYPRNAWDFNQPLNNWEVSHAFEFDKMFYNAKDFNQPLNNWDVSNGEKFYYMFYNAEKFNQDLSNWKIKKRAKTGYILTVTTMDIKYQKDINEKTGYMFLNSNTKEYYRPRVIE